MTTSASVYSPENVVGYVKSALLGKDKVDLGLIISRVKETYNLNLVDYAYNQRYGNDKSIKTVAKYIESIEGAKVNEIKGRVPTYLVSINLSGHSLKAAQFCRQTKVKKRKNDNKNPVASRNTYEKPMYLSTKNEEKVLQNRSNVNQAKSLLKVQPSREGLKSKANVLKTDEPKKSKVKKKYIFPTCESTPDIFSRISFPNENSYHKFDNSPVVKKRNIEQPSRESTRGNPPQKPKPKRVFQRTFGSYEYPKYKERRDEISSGLGYSYDNASHNDQSSNNVPWNNIDQSTSSNFSSQYLSKKQNLSSQCFSEKESSSRNSENSTSNRLCQSNSSYTKRNTCPEDTVFYRALETRGLINNENHNSCGNDQSPNLPVKDEKEIKDTDADTDTLFTHDDSELKEVLFLEDYTNKYYGTYEMESLLICFAKLSIC
uniref:H15 domain-containing protein n=1 Tax=Strongyloides papillosus TaxID=174720 RepID=A0A0N5CD65_STREA